MNSKSDGLSTLSPREVEMLCEIVDHHGGEATSLLQVLIDVQMRFRCVPAGVMTFLAEILHLPRTQIQAVVEFYSFLSVTSTGRFDVRFSDSVTDQLLGSRDLATRLCQRLGVKLGETRADDAVSVHLTSCTGLSDQGPAALVNGQVLTRLDGDRIVQMADFIDQEIDLDAWPKAWFRVEDQVQLEGLLLAEELPLGACLERAGTLDAVGIISEIDRSGLRGRGGAGFKTAVKWRFCYEGAEGTLPGDPSITRYVVCNADEGEPGTFKDRVLLSRNAHDVFEGMTVCARAIGALRGFLYLRGEYRYLLDTLLKVLEARRSRGLLGRNILGVEGFDFNIEIHLGAGAYICGEESALIESLEGKPGHPRNRPPYPVTHGYLGQPTVVNNVETFVAAARIMAFGADWFLSEGTAQSTGTKMLSVSGDCERPGIYEVPFGTPVSVVMHRCGADDPMGVQVGGPSGTFIGKAEFERILGFEDLSTGGSMMVFSQARDVVAIARGFTHFFAHESCGFCTPCRVGTSLLRQLIDKIAEGHGTPHDLVEMTQLAAIVKNASHCGLGQTAANPLMQTLERFPERYQERLKTTLFEPGFDLDGALEVSRQMTGRADANAHLTQVG